MLDKIFGKTDNKKSKDVVTKKSFSMPVGFLQSNGKSDKVSAKQALKFYLEAAPVATAIDWVNDEFKSLDLVLQQEDGTVTSDAPILDKLLRPNDDMMQIDFLETLGAYFLLTNEAYIIATGQENAEPAELLVVSPEYVTIKRGLDGFTQSIEIQQGTNGKEVYNRDITQFRFFNKARNREIWRIKGFTPFADEATISTSNAGGGLGNQMGRSKLSSVKYEIEQYLEVAKHNLAKLDNGMRPGGSITMPDGEDLSDEQFESIREQVVNFYSGGANSGKTLILPGGLKFTPIDNISDMDFSTLTDRVSKVVFNRYKVPLELVTTDQAAAATAVSAMLRLYDNAVLPLAWRLLEEITKFLMPRYNLNEKDKVLPDLNTITALQPRRNQELKTKTELGVMTTNEVRNEIGLEEGIDGGDTLYIANNLVPIGTQAVEDIPTNASETQVNAGYTSFTKKAFIDIMQDQVDKEGDLIYTKEQLEEYASDEGLK